MTCSNLICCKTGLQYVGGKTTNIAFNSLVLQHHVAKQVVCICCPFYRTLSHHLHRGLGRQKKTARGRRWKKSLCPLPIVPRTLSIFRLLLFLLRYTVPIGSLCGGERTLGEQCIYLNYMSEQRGILSAHVLYREAFISSR